MTLRRSAAYAIAALAAAVGAMSAAPALAQRSAPTVQATVAAPFSEPTRIITGTLVWSCEADTCRTSAERALNVRACRQLAREAGSIAGFTSPEGALTSDQIAACNRAARARG